MITVRHIDRLWESRKYTRLLDELANWRVEAIVANDLAERPCIAAAALALIRLDELTQSHVSICPKLIRAIIAHQEADGGWGDIMVSALAIAALSLNRGHGPSIERGLRYLADLQQPNGIWPKIPIRRMPQDAVVSAFVLMQLAGNTAFNQIVDVQAASQWFQTHETECEPNARKLWRQARCRIIQPQRMAHLFSPAN